MDRRQLLKGLLGLGAIAAVEPKKIFVLPPANGWRQENGIYTSYILPKQSLVEIVDDVLKSHDRGEWYHLGTVKGIKLKTRQLGISTYGGFKIYYKGAGKIYYKGVDTASGKDKTVYQVLEA